MNFKELADNLGLEEEEYRELIDLFISSSADDVQKIADGISAGDAEQISRAAHTVKGASANLGLVDISAAAKVIELRAMNKQLDEMPRALETLQDQIKRIHSGGAA